MFDNSEYQRRIKNLQGRIQCADLDAFVVRTDTNIMYLTGVDYYSAERKVLMLVPARGEPQLVVPRMEQERLGQAITVTKNNILTYWEMDAKPGRGWLEVFQQALGDAQRVGIEPFAEADIVAALRDRDWQVLPLVEDARVIKSSAEIALTRRVAQYWTSAMNTMLAEVCVGKSVLELMRIGQHIMAEILANEPAANHSNSTACMLLSCSPQSSSPHYFSTSPDDTLPDGATVINSMGCVNWYRAENERTILTGNYTTQYAELFDIAQQGQQLALDLIKPGVLCAEVDSAVQDFFRKEGVAKHQRHRAGHGFGMQGHERPYTSEGSAEVYRPNMLISVEPGLYVEGIGGFRHCDTVLITEDGTENFTTGTPKDRASLTF
jgi:Xaa-Pro aminopeptidase